MAQTYLDEKSPQRKAALTAAAKAFDAIFQAYRESLVGLHAHLWHGRAADELGDDQLALDIYDEVLATAPEGRERETGLEPLFAQVQYHRLLVVRRKEGIQEFLDAGQCLVADAPRVEKVRRLSGRGTGSRQGQSEKRGRAGGREKIGPHAIVAGACSPTSPKCAANISRRRSCCAANTSKPSRKTSSTVKTFDEALALGEAAAESLDWPAAVAALDRALELQRDHQRPAADRRGANPAWTRPAIKWPRPTMPTENSTSAWPPAQSDRSRPARRPAGPGRLVAVGLRGLVALCPKPEQGARPWMF